MQIYVGVRAPVVKRSHYKRRSMLRTSSRQYGVQHARDESQVGNCKRGCGVDERRPDNRRDKLVTATVVSSRAGPSNHLSLNLATILGISTLNNTTYQEDRRLRDPDTIARQGLENLYSSKT